MTSNPFSNSVVFHIRNYHEPIPPVIVSNVTSAVPSDDKLRELRRKRKKKSKK